MVKPFKFQALILMLKCLVVLKEEMIYYLYFLIYDTIDFLTNICPFVLFKFFCANIKKKVMLKEYLKINQVTIK